MSRGVVLFSKFLSLNFYRDKFINRDNILHLSVRKVNNIVLKELYDQIVKGEVMALNCGLDIADFVGMFSAVADLRNEIPELLSKIKDLSGNIFLGENDKLIVLIKDGTTKKITGYLVEGGAKC